MSFERFCQPACFLAARFTLRQPKTPVRNATNLRTFCFSDYHYESLCLSKDSLSCDTRSLDLCILFKFTFYTSDTFRPILALFTHFTLHQFFLVYITRRNIFLFPDDAVARNSIIIFIFSSRRPHLNYIFLSNVYSFDTMEFFMKQKC